ncbi:MAG: hypothetical protein U0807_01865 [Candidatus Binatia bacterium]
MDLVQVLATVVLVATLVTVLLAGMSYVAFRVREHRRAVTAEDASVKRFFVRYVLPEEDGGAAGRSG